MFLLLSFNIEPQGLVDKENYARVKFAPFSSQDQTPNPKTPNPIFFIRKGCKFDFCRELHELVMTS